MEIFTIRDRERKGNEMMQTTDAIAQLDSVMPDGAKETMTTLVSAIAGVIDDLRTVETLCGEIVATLNLEGNQKYFEDMPEHWHDLVTSWTERWRASRPPAPEGQGQEARGPHRPSRIPIESTIQPLEKASGPK
jgi:hypothetical protein